MLRGVTRRTLPWGGLLGLFALAAITSFRSLPAAPGDGSLLVSPEVDHRPTGGLVSSFDVDVDTADGAGAVLPGVLRVRGIATVVGNKTLTGVLIFVDGAQVTTASVPPNGGAFQAFLTLQGATSNGVVRTATISTRALFSDGGSEPGDSEVVQLRQDRSPALGAANQRPVASFEIGRFDTSTGGPTPFSDGLGVPAAQYTFVNTPALRMQGVARPITENGSFFEQMDSVSIAMVDPLTGARSGQSVRPAPNAVGAVTTPNGNFTIAPNGVLTFDLPYVADLTGHPSAAGGPLVFSTQVRNRAGVASAEYQRAVFFDPQAPSITGTGVAASANVGGALFIAARNFSFGGVAFDPGHKDAAGVVNPVLTGSGVAASAMVELLQGNTALDTVQTPIDALGQFRSTGVTPADGPFALRSTVLDNAGNVTQSTLNFVVDTTPPAITINQPAAGATATSPLAANVTVVDANLDTNAGRTTFQLDAGAAVNPAIASVANTHTLTANFNNVSQGSHTLTVVAFDRAGNRSASTRTFTVDNEDPVAVLTTPTAAAVRSGVVAVSGSVTDSLRLRRWELFLDGTLPGNVIAQMDVSGTAAPVAANLNTFALTDGPHTLVLRATDEAGRTGTVSTAFVTDNTAPAITITSPSAAGFVNNPVAASFLVTDANLDVTTVRATLDGLPLALPALVPGNSATVNLTLPLLNEGPHTLVVMAMDRASLAPNSAVATRPFVLDGGSPTAEITVPDRDPLNPAINDGQVRRGRLLVKGVVRDARQLRRYELYLDGLAAANQIVSRDVSGTVQDIDPFDLDTTRLTDGLHALTLRAVDDSDRIGQVTRTFVVDNAAPIINLKTPPTGFIGDADPATPGTQVPIRADLTEANGIAWRLLVDGVQVATGGTKGVDAISVTRTFADNPATPADESQGPHTIRIEANDDAVTSDPNDLTSGGPDHLRVPNGSNLTRGITIDSVAPAVTILSPTPDQFINNFEGAAFPVQLRVTELQSAPIRLELLVDGTTHVSSSLLTAGADQAVRIALDTRVITDGRHTFAVRATDNLGNTSTTAVSALVDNTAPAVTIVQPETGATVPPGRDLELRVRTDDFGGSGLRFYRVLITQGATDITGDVFTFPDAGAARILGGGEITFTAGTLNVSPEIARNGPIRIRVEVLDALGNTGAGTSDITSFQAPDPPVVRFTLPFADRPYNVNGLLPVEFRVSQLGGIRLNVASLSVTVRDAVTRQVTDQFGRSAFEFRERDADNPAEVQRGVLFKLRQPLRLSPARYRRNRRYEVVVSGVTDVNDRTPTGNVRQFRVNSR